MWIKLFFRHIARSIKLKPLQPVLSVIILTLSFAIVAMSLNAYAWLTEETGLRQAAAYGRADIAITLNSRTQNRFVSPDEVYKVLGDGVNAAGCFELPFYTADGGVALGVATDFDDIGGVFDLEFTHYGQITYDTLDNSALVSRSFAEKYSLGIGSTFSAEALGYSLTYTVQGISPREFMGKFSVMVGIGGIMRALAADSPFIAALGDDFGLCSSIYIAANGQDPAACAELLRDAPDFADKTVSVVAETMATQTNTGMLSSMIYVLVIFIAVVAAAVVFCCFYILSAQRSDENTLFGLAGANPRALFALQCTEIAAYWLTGCILGTAISLAATPAFLALSGFSYITAPFTGAFAANCAQALGITFITALLTAVGFYFLRRPKTDKNNKRRGRTEIIAVSLIFAAAAACSAAAALSPAAMHATFAVAACLCLLFAAFLAIPALFVRAVRAADAFMKKRDTGHIALCYALKNARNVKTLHNSCRLLAILVAVCAALAAVIWSGNVYIRAAQNMLPADYMLLNTGEETIARIEQCEGVASAEPLYWGAVETEHKDSLLIISAEDYSALAGPFRPDLSPQGDEAVVSQSYALLYGISAGDKLTITVDGMECTLTVKAFIRSGISTLYFDSQHFGIYPNVIAVQGDGSLSSDELKVSLARAMVLDMAVIASPAEFFEQKISLFDVYLTCGNILFLCMLFFSATGLADNLYESYRARREQFALYAACGMSQRNVRAVKLWEIATAVITGLIIGSAMSCALIYLISQWMQSYAIDLFGLFAISPLL